MTRITPFGIPRQLDRLVWRWLRPPPSSGAAGANVVAHGDLRPFGIARGDGLDDHAVLGQ